MPDPKMKQSGTDYGTKGETGEREPSGAKASDRSGERSGKTTGGVGMGVMDSMTGRDASHRGKQDGKVGEFNTGRQEGSVGTYGRGNLT